MPVTKSPVQEVGFAIQHTNDVAMTVLDVAELHDLLKVDFPLFQQADVVPRMHVPLPGPNVIPTSAESSIPRLWFMSQDSKSLVQLQLDRIALNWRRLAPSASLADYPGYNSIKQSFFEQHRLISGWLQERAMGTVEPQLGELFYVNGIPMQVDGEARRMSDILSFFTPNRQAPIFGFLVNWSEELGGDFPGSLGVNTSMGQTLDGERTMNVTFVARFSLEGADDAEASRRFDLAHQKIHDVLPYVFSDRILESFK